MTQTKFRSDVNFLVSVHERTNGGTAPDIGIGTQSQDNTMTSKMYASLADLSKDYPENTNVYNIAEAIFDVDSFNNNLVEVIQYPKDDVPTPTNVSVTPTADGAQVKATTTPGIIAGFKNHLHDGFKYLLLDGASEADYETLSDYLYDQQRIMLVAQLTSVDDLAKLQSHATATMGKTNKIDNLAAFVDTQTDRFPAAQACAFAASNIPTDFMHIGNLSQFALDENLSDDDVDQIESLNGMAIVNKAGDLMVSGGRTLAGNNFVDQFVNVNMIIDSYQQYLQHYLNQHHWPAYTDATLGEMQAGLETLGKNYIADDVLESNEIDLVKVADVLPSLVAEREYNGLSAKLVVRNDVETMNSKIDFTL